MTEFGNYLAGIKEDLRKNAAEFAEHIGIDSGNLSRIFNGQQRQLRRATLELICKNASGDKKTQAHLLAAYLRDQRAGPAKDCVHVSVRKGGKSRSAVSQDSSDLTDLISSINPTARFSKDLLKIITAYDKNKSFRKVFHSLAAFLQVRG